MNRKWENAKCPKMDAPDLTRVWKGPGDPWGPLGTPETQHFREFLGFPGFREFSLNSSSWRLLAF